MAGNFIKRDINDLLSELLSPEKEYGRSTFLEDLATGKSTEHLDPKERVSFKKAAEAEQSKGQKTTKMEIARSVDMDAMAKVMASYYPNDPFLKSLIQVVNSRR